MKDYLYLTLIEIVTLLIIILIILKAYFKQNNRNILFGGIAFFLFLVSCTAIFVRNWLDTQGLTDLVLHFLDFGYVAGMILLLGVYKK